MESPRLGLLCRAVTARAAILAAQGKGDQALSELEPLKAAAVKDPFWTCSISLRCGDVLAGMGKKAEAMTSYRTVEATTNAPGDLAADAKQKAADLEKPTPKQGNAL